MDTVQYYDGIKYIDVNPLEVLLSPTKELATSIATGPQDEFFDKLDRVNGELSRFGEDFKLSVTPSWNWKPGTIPKVRELLINKVLDVNRKSNGLQGLFQRTYDRSYYLTRHRNNFGELEALKASLKSQNYKPDVDIDKFQESMEAIVCKINSQKSIIEETTEKKVIIDTFLSGLDNPRYSKLHVEITLSNLNMNIFNGKECVHNQNLEPIFIKIEIPFRSFLIDYEDLKKRSATLPSFKGLYLSMLLPPKERASNTRYVSETYFPYIAAPYYNTRFDGVHNEPQFATVCLDNYLDEIRKSFRSLNWLDMAISLMSWAQYYDTTYSNPYNHFNTMHLGLSEDTSLAYQNLAGYSNSCPDKVNDKFSVGSTYSICEHEAFVNAKSANKFCDSLKCIHRNNGNCNQYKTINHMLESIKDEEWSYQVESFVGYIQAIEHIDLSNRNQLLWDILDQIETSGLNVNGEDFYYRLYYYLRARRVQSGNIIRALYNYTNYWNTEEENNINPSEDLTAEATEELMLRWATTGGR